MATWDDAAGKLTIYGAAKVPFFNRRILSAQIGLPVEQIEMIENDVGGGYGARGEFYPEDFLIPFAARHVKRPVKWIEDRRENLMAMNHAREEECDLEVACARDGTILAIRGEVHTDMGAYMRTNGAVGARNVCAVHGRAVPRAARQDRLVALDDQQDAGRHLSRAGPLRGQFLPRAHDRHDRGRSRHRPHRVPPQEPRSRAPSSPIRSPMCSRPTPRTSTTAANTLETLDRALKEIDWPKISKLQGKLIDGKYHGLGVVCFIEGGAAGPKEMRADRDQQGRHHVGLHGHVVGRAGRRDGVRADRRRRARSADRAHPSRLSRLDRLCERRLRRLPLALDRDGRLGGARRHQQFHGDLAPGRRQAAGLRRVQRHARHRQGDGRRPVDGASGIRRAHRRGRVPQQEAHLQLRRARRHITVDAQARPDRDRRLRGGAGRRPRGQSADAARPGAGLAGAGARRRGAGGSEIRRERPVPHRLARRLSPADRHRLSQSALRRARRLSVADQSARRQGRGRGRHHRRRRLHGECGGQCAAVASACSRAQLPLSPAYIWELVQAGQEAGGTDVQRAASQNAVR